MTTLHAHTLTVLATLAVGGGASRLVASVIEHSNASAAFVWNANREIGLSGKLLDPLLPANQQVEALLSRSLSYGAGVGGGSESPQGDTVSGSATMRVIRSTTPLLITNNSGIVTTFRPLEALAVGASVGPGANYQTFGNVAIYYLGGNLVNAPLLGQRAFIGFNMSLAEGPHFGFVELMFTTGPVGNSGEIIPMYQPVRWAYESQPNVPIVVPGPGPVLALVLFAPLAARRKRG